jgi:hypothetical protein
MSDVINLEVTQMRETLALVIKCGQQAEAARRANFHSFALLQQILESAINAPDFKSRGAYVRQAKRLVDEILTEGFSEMPWPQLERELQHGGN